MSKEISNWNNEDVTSWLKELGLSNVIDSFQNNQITGYDLCYLNELELKEELRVTRFHDRSLLLRSIREYTLEQRKLYFKE